MGCRVGSKAPRSAEGLASFKEIHYQRTMARFWASVLPATDAPCSTYRGRRTSKGYGRIKVRGRMVYAHRLAWEVANGPIPNGLHVLHHCDNPPCCKTAPDATYPQGHLYLGTNDDNITDRMERNPPVGLTGSSHPSSKLTRYAAGGVSQPQLSREYGISQSHVGRLVHRQSWPDE